MTRGDGIVFSLTGPDDSPSPSNAAEPGRPQHEFRP
ncbi:hypothetical protein QE392_000650 [Microbacterium proteolyticum]|nr:hypothetical protein [Microbacterium sp. SORGH_AS_0344]MDQ1168846.1 hypothetical protein [Microbacterium proteolyticum]